MNFHLLDIISLFWWCSWLKLYS